MTPDEITAMEVQIEVVPLAMHSIRPLIQMQEAARAAINAITDIDVLLENLPIDMPTAEELARGHWYRNMRVNKETGEVEIERIPDIHER